MSQFLFTEVGPWNRIRCTNYTHLKSGASVMNNTLSILSDWLLQVMWLLLTNQSALYDYHIRSWPIRTVGRISISTNCQGILCNWIILHYIIIWMSKLRIRITLAIRNQLLFSKYVTNTLILNDLQWGVSWDYRFATFASIMICFSGRLNYSKTLL